MKTEKLFDSWFIFVIFPFIFLFVVVFPFIILIESGSYFGFILFMVIPLFPSVFEAAKELWRENY